MSLIEKNKFAYLILHLLLGVIVYFIEFAVYPYFAAVLFFGTIWIIRTKDEGHQVLFLMSYIIGLEVLFRMKSGGSLYDIGKYSIIYFAILGFGFRRIDLRAWPYFLVLLLFIPGIVLTVNTFFFEIDVRKKIMFNLLGPFSLILASLYCYNKSLTLSKFLDVLYVALGPLVTILVNLYLYTPSNLKEAITNTSSNFATSGGFGPNQMSVVLGLGVFITFTFLLFANTSKRSTVVFFILCFLFSYRGLLTFSRGGMMTAGAMILVFLFALNKILNANAKSKLKLVVVMSIIFGSIVWFFTSLQTDGMIDKRYANKDAAGRIKESKLSGREDIMEYDIKTFIENPILGVGPGISSTARDFDGMFGAQSHSEPTRLLAEHGSLGVLILIILIFTPIIKWIRYRQFHNVFFLSFLLFWLLTINHAATRIAATGVIYAFTLLIIRLSDDEYPVHRE